jgi:hypothetical protein
MDLVTIPWPFCFIEFIAASVSEDRAALWPCSFLLLKLMMWIYLRFVSEVRWTVWFEGVGV